MSSAARRAEFFALEAGEYLADLAPLVNTRELPDAERLVRGARALRGAALMAGLGTFARAAASLEGIARQVRDHALAWEPDAREAWSDGLSTLRGLVPRATAWGGDDDRQALALVDRLERFTGAGTGRPVASAAPSTALTAGVRAFIARESALIAGSFAQAARALAPTPPPAALSAVLERMQSLRGLGASAELSPLPELLDAMELATRTLLGEAPPPPDIATIFADAAHAMSAIAKSLGDGGRVTLPPTLERVSTRLLETYAAEIDVVPIADLAPAGEESIAQHGTPPAPTPDATPVALELVGVGDHLLSTADALAKPATTIARDLRLFVLHRTLATMPPRSATGRFLAPLAQAITGAIGQGVAAQQPEAFVTMLRQCGRFLVDSAGTTDRAALARQRDRLASGIGGAPPAEQSVELDDELLGTPIVSIASLAPDAESDVVAIESLAPDSQDEELDVVPIASLAPEAFPSEIVPIESLAPDDAPAPGSAGILERAYSRRRELLYQLETVPPTLAGLTTGAVGGDVEDAAILPVSDLLYRGVAALDRAEEVRAEINAILAEPTISLDSLRPWIQELLDLVPLARDAA